MSLSSLALPPLPIDDWAWSLPPSIGLGTYSYRKVVVCGSGKPFWMIWGLRWFLLRFYSAILAVSIGSKKDNSDQFNEKTSDVVIQNKEGKGWCGVVWWD